MTECVFCSQQKLGGYFEDKSLSYPPYNATDIQVLDNGVIRDFNRSDWSSNRHKLLLFYPEANTPVCASEMGAVNDWIDEFDKLDCDVFSVTADTIEEVQQWYEDEESLKNPRYKALSSMLLPMRLGVYKNNRSMRASVIITKDSDVIVQQHFMKVGRSLEELHRNMYAYTTGSYCAHGWKSPADGFLEK
jgi:alkyl hydroperoxide reductase subunit AhpC